MIINQQQSIVKSRLGIILTKGAYINHEQLCQALAYQAKRGVKLGTALLELKLISRRRLNLALKQQSWTRTIAAAVAIACSPFASVFASEKVETKLMSLQSSPTKEITNSTHNLNVKYTNNYSNHAFSKVDYSNKYDQTNSVNNFYLNKNLSGQNSLHFSLLAQQYNTQETNVIYELSPQISLLNFTSKPEHTAHKNKEIRSGLNRYSNTKPVTFMLTIKGRCLMQNSDEITKLWSLEKVSNGIQRKAQLMFSITKEF